METKTKNDMIDKEMLKALEESMETWENKTEKTRENCPLCDLSIKRREDDGRYSMASTCDYCIIKKRTGMDSCQGTPHHDDKYKPFPEYKRSMIDYLKSFLPQEKEGIKMRKVVIENRDPGVVSINEVDNDKVYGYKLNSSSDIRLLRNIDEKYKWISMQNNTWSRNLSFTSTNNLMTIIKQVYIDYDGVVYEFDTMNDFYKWATE